MNERLPVTCAVCQATVLLEYLDANSWKLLGPDIPGNCIVLHSLLINETPLRNVRCPNLENAKKRATAEYEESRR